MGGDGTQVERTVGSLTSAEAGQVGIRNLGPRDVGQRLSSQDGGGTNRRVVDGNHHTHRMSRAGAQHDFNLVGDAIVIGIGIERVGGVFHFLPVDQSVAIGVHIAVQCLAVASKRVRVFRVGSVFTEEELVVVGETIRIVVRGFIGGNEVNEMGVLPPVLHAVLVGVASQVVGGLLGLFDGEASLIHQFGRQTLARLLLQQCHIGILPAGIGVVTARNGRIVGGSLLFGRAGNRAVGRVGALPFAIGTLVVVIRIGSRIGLVGECLVGQSTGTGDFTVIEVEVRRHVGGRCFQEDVAVVGDFRGRALSVPDTQFVNGHGEAFGGIGLANHQVAISGGRVDAGLLGLRLIGRQCLAVAHHIHSDVVGVRRGVGVLLDHDRHMGPAVARSEGGMGIGVGRSGLAPDEVGFQRELEFTAFQVELEVTRTGGDGRGLLDEVARGAGVIGELEPQLDSVLLERFDLSVEVLDHSMWSGTGVNMLRNRVQLARRLIEFIVGHVMRIENQIEGAVEPRVGGVVRVGAQGQFIPVIIAIAIGVFFGRVGAVVVDFLAV